MRHFINIIENQTVTEDTVQNMSVLRDCADAIIATLPGTIPANDVVDFNGRNIRGLSALIQKYEKSSYADAVSSIQNLHIVIDNRYLGHTMGAYLSRPINQLKINLAAFMGSAEAHSLKDALSHRRNNDPIKSLKAVIVHELRHFFQEALYQAFYHSKSETPYKKNPIEIDAAWNHHLEDFKPEDFSNAAEYASAVMTSFAGYKDLTPSEADHFKRKTIRFFLDSRQRSPNLPATPKERLEKVRKERLALITSALGAVGRDIDLRQAIPDYSPDASMFLFPSRVFQGANAILAKNDLKVLNNHPANGVTILLAIALALPEKDLPETIKFLKAGLNIDALIGRSKEAFEKWDADAIERYLREKFGESLEEALSNPPEIKDFATAFNDDKINKEVQRQAARKNPAWKKKLVQVMKQYGFALVGAGVNGAVFQNPSYPFVLKVYRTDAAYEEWLYFVRTHQKNKFVPKVKGNIIRLNKIFSAVRLETLRPCSNDVANKLIDHIERVQNVGAGSFKKRDEEWAKEDPDLIEIVKFMRDWEAHSDLSAHNVMCRENGQPVIIDPLYFDPERMALEEDAVSLDNGGRLIVSKNPNVATLRSLLKRSSEGHLRGLVVGKDTFWWDAGKAIHGQIAKALGHENYHDDRLNASLDDGAVMIDSDHTVFEKWSSIPAMRRLFNSDEVFFYASGAGWIPFECGNGT